MPVSEKHAVLGMIPAQDYPISPDETKLYFYEVVGDVTYKSGKWPEVIKTVLNRDTILLLHDCNKK